MPVHFPFFFQQVQRYCEKSLISRKVLALWFHCQQCSNAVSHLEFEMEDAAAGWELVFSTLSCRQNGSYKKNHLGRLTFAYPEKKHTVWFTKVFQFCAAWPQICQPSRLHCTGGTDIRDLFCF